LDEEFSFSLLLAPMTKDGSYGRLLQHQNLGRMVPVYYESGRINANLRNVIWATSAWHSDKVLSVVASHIHLEVPEEIMLPLAA